jgi:DNA-binding beta-propeller fold protein YncE
MLKKPAFFLCVMSVLAQDFKITKLGGVSTGVFDEGAAEIAAYDPGTKRVFFVNAFLPAIEALDLTNPAKPVAVFRIFIPAIYGKVANSLAVKNGILAVAVEADPKTNPGTVLFFDTNGNLQGSVKVGAQPDMITFTPDGKSVLTANEGEPSANYKEDPEGSVSIIDVSKGVIGIKQDAVRTADFKGFKKEDLDSSIRIYGRNATVAQDLEPEYIAVAPNSMTAYVTLQENNAIGILDLATAKFTKLVGLGFKDHSKPGNGLDASDRDNAINIANWPVLGMYQPDGIAAFEAKGKTWLITANEGDAREWGDFAEEARVSTLTLDAQKFPNGAALKNNAQLGRLTVTTFGGDTDGDGDQDRLLVLGGRSFSIWDATGKLVWDSGDQFEKYFEKNLPDFFNVSSTNNTKEDRSDNKGPEPEGVVVSEINGKLYAFICLERMSGVMVYDVTDPEKPVFVNYTTSRDFKGNPRAFTAGDLAPEGIVVIPAADSPTKQPLLALANEVSGTMAFYQISAPAAAVATEAKIAAVDRSTTLRELTFDGSGSVGTGLKYKWKVSGGSSGIFPQSGDTPKITVQFAQGYTDYVIELTVTDSAGNTSVATRTVTYVGR